ncbi:PAS domain-containing protein [Antarcticirhabdus aurantiaca]|uniref:PAS domain-containing protein n=1 Tax=Antarcticirhabdus aurantiaca TaxID=2606717 RepID=A0ACD4NS03_9HYPH|nr:PAS domain-containing protein [Antarcticirhabdus aurantiaca]WAJ29523.1 PAS domain-containing protein [Jeongeuplla avenae]
MMSDDPNPSFKGDAPVAARREVLIDRRELALVAMERTRMPMVITDPKQPDNPIILANEAFLELTGYAAEEVLGRNCRFLQGVDTDPADVEAIRAELAAGNDHFEVELLNYRKDGSSFWNQLVISPVRNEAGLLLYYFASQKDVTARRRAEQLEIAERLLLKEVDHRAMNALALVQGIVNLSRSESPAQYSASIRGRVAALARAHRLLAVSGWTGADVGALLAGEIPAHMRERVRTSGTAALLPALLVQPLSLVLHEIMSNALRHGGLSKPGGFVEVGWSTEPEGLRLDWRERGAGAIGEPPRFEGGMRMVKNVVERQLCGQASFAWSPPGFQATLRIPLDG